MIEFIDAEEGYLNWITEHPEGFVVNCERTVRPEYLVLHRSTCGHVSSPKNSNYTTNEYIKICSEDVEDLEAWASNEAGGSLTPCKSCAPTGRTRISDKAPNALTQRINEKDIEAGRIRIPAQRKGYSPINLVRSTCSFAELGCHAVGIPDATQMANARVSYPWERR